MTLPILRVSRKEMNIWFDRPYNPPAILDDSAAEHFSEEYWRVHERIRAVLEGLGGICDPIEGDFGMNDSRGDSRWVSVDLVTPALAKRETLEELSGLLRALPDRYAIWLSHEEPAEPLFHVIVTSDRVVVTGVDTGWLRSLTGEIC